MTNYHPLLSAFTWLTLKIRLCGLNQKAFVCLKLLLEFLNANSYFMLLLQPERISAPWVVLDEVCVNRRGYIDFLISSWNLCFITYFTWLSSLPENSFDSLSQCSVQVIVNALSYPWFPSIPVTHPQCLQSYVL